MHMGPFPNPAAVCAVPGGPRSRGQGFRDVIHATTVRFFQRPGRPGSIHYDASCTPPPPLTWRAPVLVALPNVFLVLLRALDRNSPNIQDFVIAIYVSLLRLVPPAYLSELFLVKGGETSFFLPFCPSLNSYFGVRKASLSQPAISGRVSLHASLTDFPFE